MNAASGYVFSSLHRVEWNYFWAVDVSAWGGIYPTVIMIEENYLGRSCGRHLIVRNSKSGEQKDLSSCMLLWSNHDSLIIRHTPPPFFLPERCLFLSVRCVKKPGGCTDSDNVSQVSHVSMKQRMLQSLMSLWKANLAQILSTLLSRVWTLASSILERCAMCPSTEPDQKTAPSAPSVAPLFWVADWDPMQCPGF